jgi:16S rRNA (guanine966-N2)-methyltransferase
VVGAKVLDLFAGTGALGIEALSRGAAEAMFVDSSPGAVGAIKANLERTKLGERATVLRSRWEDVLRRRPRAYDLAFLDPPYDRSDQEVSAVLSALERGWIASRFTVAVTRARKGYSDGISVNWQVAKRLEYGDTLIVLYREV